MSDHPITIRYTEDGRLDEVVAQGASVHLECMDDFDPDETDPSERGAHWWLGVRVGRLFVHVNLDADAVIEARAERDDEPEDYEPKGCIVWIHEASHPVLVGRRAELLWTDIDDDGTFACVRMLDGEPVDYGDPDGFTVICTAWGPRPPQWKPRERLPDDRVCRWRLCSGA